MNKLGRRAASVLGAAALSAGMLATTASPASAGTSAWYTTGTYGELTCYNQWTADYSAGATCDVADGYYVYWRVKQDCTWGGTYYSYWILQDGDDGYRTVWGPTKCTWGINSITVQFHY